MLEKEGMKKGIFYIALFIFMLIIIIIFRNNKKTFKYKNEKEVKQTIVENINKISDNYSLNIIEHRNEEEYKLEYMTDSKMQMYSSDAFKVTGYLIYNNQYYQLDNGELKKVKAIEINGIFNEKYYNFELIKNIVDKCEIKKSSMIRFTCDVKLSDYLEEYNNLFNANVVGDDDSSIEFEFLYDSEKVRSINIDYTNLVKYTDNINDTITYSIDIDDINKNDFSEYIGYIEKKN